MSRIGKKAVPIPSGVTASVEGQTVKMKGPKGALQFVVPDEIVVKMDKGAIKVDPRSDTKRALAMWGTSRTLVANLVTGVTATVEGQTVKMKGPKGALQVVLPDEIVAKMEDGAVKVDPRGETDRGRAMWGTSRTLVANLVTGVTKGFETKLEISGVGYRAAVQGKNLQIALGYSHDVVFAIPEGIAIATPKPTEIVVTGIDKQKVGQVAAEIRAFRGPEPYKGKGVKYAGEFIFRKEGKKK